MSKRFTTTSKLEKLLYRLRLNEQTSTESESSVGFLLLTLEEVNPTSQTSNCINKLCHWLKLSSIIEPWRWINKLCQLEEIRSEGRHFGSLKWREKIKINRTTKVNFCNLIMIDSDYFTSEEYNSVFGFKENEYDIVLEKQSEELTRLFLLPLKVSCKRLPVHGFREELIEEILEAVGYLTYTDGRRDLKRAVVDDIVPAWDFRDYRKLSLSTFPDTLKDSLQTALLVLAIAAVAITGIDISSNLSSSVLKKSFNETDLAEIADFSQFVSLFILYITLVGLLVFLAIATAILLRESRSSQVAILTGWSSLLILVILFPFLIYITCLFVIGLDLRTTKWTTFGILLICLFLYLFLVLKRDALLFRHLLSLPRTVLVALHNLQKRLFKRNILIK